MCQNVGVEVGVIFVFCSCFCVCVCVCFLSLFFFCQKPKIEKNRNSKKSNKVNKFKNKLLKNTRGVFSFFNCFYSKLKK